MRKLVGSTLLASAVLATSALATNGDNMIGVSPASRAMGGIGVGMPTGKTDAIFRNPAWMNTQKGFNVSFGGILFLPNVKGRSKQGTSDSGYVKSDADTFTIPEVAIVNQISDDVTIGIGAFGVSGMGVDYRNKSQLLANMHTSLQFMRIIPAISYKISDNLSIGGALDFAWGSLDLGAVMSGGTYLNRGGGQSQDYGIGAQLGIAYNMNDFIYLGFNYQSSIKMKYEKVFDSDGNGSYEDLKLEQPQEVAAGIGIRPVDNLKLGFDVRWINWSDADGYKQFKWKDQWVFAIGGEYKIDKLYLRAGYNYGKSPIRSKNNLDPVTPKNKIPDFTARFSDFQVEWFNLIGFPAITEHHITLGAGYQFTKNFSLAVSYVHAFEKKVESTATGGAALAGAKNSQDSIGVGLEWTF